MTVAVRSGAARCPPDGLGRRELAGLAALALAVRLIGLGSSSLWLDEVLLMVRATAGGPAAVWAACRANAEHPPLSALAAAVVHAAGAGEVGQRLVTVVLGAATVVLLAAWTARRFDRPAGWWPVSARRCCLSTSATPRSCARTRGCSSSPP